MLGSGRIGATLPTPTLYSTQVQTFHGDLLQHMEKNTKLDMQFIKVSLAAHLGPPPQPITGKTAPPHLMDEHTEACAGYRLAPGCTCSQLSPRPPSRHATQGQPPAL